MRYIFYFVMFLFLLSCNQKKDHPPRNKIIISNSNINNNHFYSVLDLIIDQNNAQPIYSPSSVIFAGNGDILVVDEKRIKRYSEKGKFLNYISNLGQGPGEASFPRFIFAKDQKIVFTDSRQKKVNFIVFEISGKLLEVVLSKSYNLKLFPGSRLNTAIYYFPTKNVLAYSAKPYKNKKKFLLKREYAIATLNGELIKKLDLDFSDVFIQFTKLRNYIFPFANNRDVIKILNKIFILSADGNQFSIVDFDGNIEKNVLFNLTKEVIPHQLREEYINSKKDISNIDFSDLPKYKPLFTNVIVDAKERVWLKSGRTFVSEKMHKFVESFEYFIFDKTMKYIGKLIIPCDIYSIYGDSVVGIYTDENGIKTVRKYLINNDK